MGSWEATARLYRKKPTEVTAIQYTGKNDLAVADFVGDSGHVLALSPDWLIHTLEGDMRASPGDFIIRGVAGEFYPCKPDIFAATYEAATVPEWKVEGASGHIPWEGD